MTARCFSPLPCAKTTWLPSGSVIMPTLTCSPRITELGSMLAFFELLDAIIKVSLDESHRRSPG